MAKLFITLSALSGMLAVVFGAFGAHALKNKLDDYAMGIFETAVQYHFYHTLALFGVGILALRRVHRPEVVHGLKGIDVFFPEHSQRGFEIVQVQALRLLVSSLRKE